MDAERFAAMWAGLDAGNDETEAIAKFRMLRRKVIASKQRIVDVLELPEVKAALDAQMQPVRHGGDAALQTENDELRANLAVVVPKVTELAEALKKERDDMRYGGCFVSVLIVVTLVSAYHFFDGIGLVMALFGVIGMLGLIGRGERL